MHIFPQVLKLYLFIPVTGICIKGDVYIKESYRCRQWTQGSVCVMMGVVSHVPYLDSGSQNGILSALPYISAYICIVLGGLLADYLFSRKILRLNTIRKLFTVIGKNWGGYRGGYGILRAASYSLCVCSPAPGVVIPSAFTVSLFWVRSSFGATIAFLILAFSFKSIVQSGALINFMDIAPRYGLLCLILTEAQFRSSILKSAQIYGYNVTCQWVTGNFSTSPTFK